MGKQRKKRVASRAANAPARSTDRASVPAGSPRPDAAAAGLALLALLAFSPSLFAGFVWDDDAHFATNPAMLDLAGLGRLWTEKVFYYPLTSTTFWIQRRLWGLHPFPYHALNVALHATNAVLVHALLRRLRVPGAWLGAALFASHPVMTQSVAWATELKNTQSGLFFFLALLAHDRAEEEGSRRSRAAALLAFAAALLSKTSAAMLPCALVAMRAWRRRPLDRAFATRVAPFFLMSAGAAAATILFHREHVAGSDDWNETVAERFAIAGRCVWFYLGKLALPLDLSFVYPRWDVRADAASILLPWGAMAAVAALCFATRRRGGRGTFLALAFFVSQLFPVLNFFRMYYTRFSYVADHWQYLASTGIFALAGAAAATAIRSPRILRAVAGIVLCALVAASARQSLVYRDAETLWRDVLSKNPDSSLAATNLAGLLAKRGEEAEATALLERAVARAPDRSEPLVALGNMALARGRADEALARYNAAIAARPRDPNARTGAALALLALRRVDEARVELETALAIDPDHAAAHLNLAQLLETTLGDATKAAEHYRRAVASDPGNARAHYRLGSVADAAGRTEEARRSFARAAKLDPQYAAAHAALGSVLARMRDPAGAVEHLARAVEFAPDDAWARLNLGLALIETGRRAEGLAEISRGALADPAVAERARAMGFL